MTNVYDVLTSHRISLFILIKISDMRRKMGERCQCLFEATIYIFLFKLKEIFFLKSRIVR